MRKRGAVSHLTRCGETCVLTTSPAAKIPRSGLTKRSSRLASKEAAALCTRWRGRYQHLHTASAFGGRRAKYFKARRSASPRVERTADEAGHDSSEIVTLDELESTFLTPLDPSDKSLAEFEGKVRSPHGQQFCP